MILAGLCLPALATEQTLTSLVARRLLDVERGAIIEDAVLVIEGKRIIAAGPQSSTSPRGRIIDLGDVTLLPGLIDAHVHLNLGGSAESNARTTLLAGFTTVQDLGALDYANIRLRDAINGGRTVGPRIVASGPWLGISKGTCDFNGIGVRGAEAFRDRVRKDIAQGADLVKVCASGWLAEAAQQPTAYEISDDELSAAIEEAHRAKRRVAVHAISERALNAAVLHGADLLVHGGFTSGETVAAMKGKGVLQLPTLWSFSRNNPPELYERLRAHMAASARLGLPLAFGTDAGVIPHGRNAAEFLELERIGLTRAAAIRTATIDGARAVGLNGQVGALTPGLLADVIAVPGHPLENLESLQTVTFVMKDGLVVRPAADARQPDAASSHVLSRLTRWRAGLCPRSRDCDPSRSSPTRARDNGSE